MDVGMAHTHTLMVGLYMLQLLVKVALLLSGNKERLDSFSKRVSLPSIAVSIMMLGTGIFLMVKTQGYNHPYIWLKIGLMLASIPMGIIGFKRGNKALAVGSFAVLLAVVGLALTKPVALRGKGGVEIGADAGEDKEKIEAGKVVYTQKCTLCHGPDGTLGFQGAKNLKTSVLDDAGIRDIVRNGKGMMPGDTELTDTQVDQLIAYVKYLRK